MSMAVQRPLSTRRKAAWSMLAGAMVAAWLTGCAAVGPDYQRPAPRTPAKWHSELGSGLNAMEYREMEWWAAFSDPLLQSLIEAALTNNLDSKEARARVREARARRGFSQAGQFPTLDASAAANRSKSSGSATTRNYYAVGFDAGWELDIFGGVRRAVEAAEAELDASREGLADVLVTLTAEVALNYLDVRTFQARLAVAHANLALQQQSLELTEFNQQAGVGDERAVAQARANLENSRAQLPGLRQGLGEAKNRLAVLTGRLPGSVHGLLAAQAAIPTVSSSVAVGIPAETLRRRPDVRRAERLVAAQTARIGVATADLYPKFRLLGSIGLESLKSSELFTSASETWRLGPTLAWNLFDAGAIRQNIEVHSAIQEQYLLAYEGAVLAALEEVENALTAYGHEQLRRQRLQAAVAAARQAEALAAQQYQAGLVDFVVVLDAQRSLLAFEDQLAVSAGTVSGNLIRLYKALGGGWGVPAAPISPEKG
ncbi:MAG: efflux transporter outer membrane subunit [Desulfurivibrionaceae bacterium]|nr:efflux transporter outer membrane subunit [Desulfurivibrionaceae bacterium]